MKNDIYMHVKTHQVLCLDFSYRRGSTIVRSKSCSSHVCRCLTGYSFIISSPLVSHIRVSELVSIVTACCLFGAKPYPEPMLVYCKWDSREQISVKFESEFYHFHSRKCISKCRLPEWRPFCPWGDGSTQFIWTWVSVDMSKNTLGLGDVGIHLCVCVSCWPYKLVCQGQFDDNEFSQ